MAKLSRSVLKEIVKECIVEIFEESFFSTGNQIVSENIDYEAPRKKIKRPRPKASSDNLRPALDSVSFGEHRSGNVAFEKKIDAVTKKMTSDPIMEGIFKDTARTTLQSQSNKGISSRTAGDAASIKVSKSNPEDLFSSSAGKWAALAFAQPLNK